MINNIPYNWNYQDNMEMLFMFYQLADELLSETTSDSYSLPLHNTISILCEMGEVYNLLEQYGAIESYYHKYIPPIIDEFLYLLEADYLLKKKIALRLDSIRTGFIEAKNNSMVLSRWINIVNQICTIDDYLNIYREELIELVVNTKEKNKLIYCAQNFFIMLRTLGYSREYLYIQTKKYFSNDQVKINDAKQIINYLNELDGNQNKYDFLILMDINSIEYIDSVSGSLSIKKYIEIVDADKIRENEIPDQKVEELLEDYNKRIKQLDKYSKMAIIRFHDEDYDPYSSMKSFNEYILFLQTFVSYFKHFYTSKQIYKILLKLENGHYREIEIPNRMQKRPYINQDVIDSRIRDIVDAKYIGRLALSSITKAIAMHAEAYDSRSTSIRLRTFWTALETLFADPKTTNSRENVINCVAHIIEKTYILKKSRAIYMLLTQSIQKEELKKIGINTFQDFIEFISSYKIDSPEMKKFFSLLSMNPLLRTRIYDYRKRLNNGVSIQKSISNHQKKIEWQLNRLYRIRNIATHMGEEVRGMEIVVNHLHNYFDYVVNYLLCKAENHDFIISVSTIVFEAKNDNQLYYEMLKKNEDLSGDNYLGLLFGPDPNMINYKFEHYLND